jgi:hypothetical protein
VPHPDRGYVVSVLVKITIEQSIFHTRSPDSEPPVTLSSGSICILCVCCGVRREIRAEPSSPPLPGELPAKLLVTPTHWRKCTHLSLLRRDWTPRVRRSANHDVKGPLKSTLRPTPSVIDSAADRSIE